MAAVMSAGCLGESTVDGGEPTFDMNEPAPDTKLPPVGNPPGIKNWGSWPCGNCFEPTLASDGEWLYGTVGGERNLWRTNGAAWERLPPPPVPSGLEATNEFDIFIQVDDAGRLWWSAMVDLEDPAHPDGIFARLVHVARTDDAGITWAINHILALGPSEVAVGLVDRQWLAVSGETVAAFWTNPAPGAPGLAHVALSRDGGKSFEAPQPIPQATGRPGPLGPPAVSGDIVVMPFLLGKASVAVVVSSDWETWQPVIVWSPVDAAERLGPYCCAFPNAVGNESGFVVSWIAEDGAVIHATSGDGLSWALQPPLTSSAKGVYPHPWPVLADDGLHLVWHDDAGGVHVGATNGSDVLAGTFVGLPNSPGDYMHGILHQGMIVTAWMASKGNMHVAGFS